MLTALLERAPDLTGLRLLEYLEDTFPGEYDQRVLQTLQRLVQHWKAVSGPDKAVIFRQAVNAEVKIPSLWVVAGHDGLLNFTPMEYYQQLIQAA